MRYIQATILIAATVVTGAGAQELTMEEAVATALENNPSILAARERAEAAASRVEQVKGHRLPSLDLSEIYSYTNNPAEVFAFQLNQERFDFEDFTMSDPNRPDPLTTWITRAELTIPIYTGGQLGARVGQASAVASAEEGRFRHVRQQVAFETITAFANLAKSREQAELMLKSRDTTAEHLKLAEAYQRQGILVDAEVLQARVFLAKMEELLAQALNGSRVAEAALNFHMGVGQATPRTLAELPPPPPVRGELADWSSASVTQRNDLVAARLELEAGRLEQKAARSGFLPEIAAMGRYDLFDDRAFGDNGSSGSIMAIAKINLFRGGSDSAKRTAARHETASFEQDIRRFEEGVQLEVYQAWHDLETARARLATASESLAAAREALRVREQRFKQGLEKMIDLLDAETTLREARLRELVARYDVSLSTYRLLFSSGGSLIPSTEVS
jgi:outer membrane protein TolC